MVVYEFGPFRLDAQRLLLYLDGTPVALGPKVVQTLLALVERAGDVLSKRALLERIWPEGYVEEANLTQNVYVLRKLLRTHRCEGAIVTIARRGYRFTAPVRRLEASTGAPRPHRRRLRALAAGCAAALVLAGAAAWSYGLSREQAPGPMTAEARLYTMGSFMLSMRTSFSLSRSIGIFTRAVRSDPAVARDYAGRATAYALLADYGYGPGSRDQNRARARADVTRALALNHDCGRAYGVLGLLALDAGRDDEALSRLRTAVLLAPGDADAREWYGIALLSTGAVRAAQTQLQIAQRLNPLSVATTAWIASVAYLEHRYGEAVREAHIALAIAPNRYGLWITLGLAQEAQGSYGAAVASFSRYARSCSGCKAEAAALLAYTYARLGQLQTARFELSVARSGAARPEDLALALAVVGERGIVLRRLVDRMSLADRALVSDDPRFGALTSRQLRIFEGQG
jgi:DNA-binding winged helix-turn-helix (wHTH) protein/tetratricopeptide (TPR) repeat protein